MRWRTRGAGACTFGNSAFGARALAEPPNCLHRLLVICRVSRKLARMGFPGSERQEMLPLCGQNRCLGSICKLFGHEDRRDRRHAGFEKRILEAATRFPFSPPAFQDSLKTSIFQVHNRTTGVAMSQIRQSDVKNHLSPRFHTKIHLCDPVSQPDATGYSAPEPDAIQADPSIFARDFIAEHSFSGAAAAPADAVAGSIRLHLPTASKSTQA